MAVLNTGKNCQLKNHALDNIFNNMSFIDDAHAQDDAVVEQFIQKAKEIGTPVTCAAGCSACCSEPVIGDRSEVEHLLRSLSESQIAVVRVKTERWLKNIRKTRLLASERPNVIDYRAANLVCPLLMDNLCSVYNRRPTSCRHHLAIGPRRKCDKLKERPNQTFIKMPQSTMASLQILALNLPVIVMDHIGVHLADLLLGDKVPESAAKMPVTIDP